MSFAKSIVMVAHCKVTDRAVEYNVILLCRKLAKIPDLNSSREQSGNRESKVM